MPNGVATFILWKAMPTLRDPSDPNCPCHGEPAGAIAVDESFADLVRALVHAHRGDLAQLAHREGLEMEDAFDAVQEAFITFLDLPQARALVAAPDEARALLAVITRNVARNRRRLHAVARPHTSAPEVIESLAHERASVEELVVAAEEHARLAGCLRTLAETHRTVVTLRMLDELPGEAVGRALGMTPGHVAVLLNRAKAKLLACMTASAANQSR